MSLGLSDWALASIWSGAVADSAGLPAQRVHLEQLIPRASSAILEESRCVPRLRLDFCGRLVLLGRVLLGDRFRSPLEVFFAELELRHRPHYLLHRRPA